MLFRKKLSPLGQFAKDELKILSRINSAQNHRPLIEPFYKELIALLDAVGKHSDDRFAHEVIVGCLSDTVKKLGHMVPIAPLTGHTDEWTEHHPGYWQNKRNDYVLRIKGQVQYFHAIRWIDQDGNSFRAIVTLQEGVMVPSTQYVKSFPFTPKTFKIKVHSEQKEGQWILTVADPEDLKKVWEYYKPFVIDNTKKETI